MTEYRRLTDKGRAGLQALLDADSLDESANGIPGAGYLLNLPDGWTEPVPPPLPPEPPDGSAFRVRFRDGATAVIERDDRTEIAHGDRRWFSTAMGGDPASWEEVAAPGATLTVLAPVPEPVKLPWRAQYSSDREPIGLRIYDDGADRVAVEIAAGEDALGSYWSPATARDMAAALLSAADEAERNHG
jgi:hypothetical protein